jgi:hypothetical protein
MTRAGYDSCFRTIRKVIRLWRMNSERFHPLSRFGTQKVPKKPQWFFKFSFDFQERTYVWKEEC